MSRSTFTSIIALLGSFYVFANTAFGEAAECAETDSACKAAKGASMLQGLAAQQRASLKAEKAKTQTMLQSACEEVPVVRTASSITNEGLPPPKVADPMSLEDCTHLIRVLRKHAFFSVIEFLCESPEKRERFRRMNGGCLYVPSGLVMSALSNRTEFLSPWTYVQMLETSYFENDINSQCPSEVDGLQTQEVTSRGAAVLHPCPGSESGFVSESGNCIDAGFIGTHGNLRIYKLHGLFGLDRDLQQYVSSTCDDSLSAEPMPTQYAAGRNGRSIAIPTDFVVCHGGTPREAMVQNPVTQQQLEEQLELANKAYAGTEGCTGFKAYTPDNADTGISFVFGQVTEKTDTQCMNCGRMMSNPSLLRHYARNVAPQQSGRLNILICNSGNGLMGMAYFPNHPQFGPDKQIIFVTYGTLPNNAQFSVGDVLAHEIGHRLNLFHTFQGGCSAGGDGVADTNPMEQARDFTCPSSASSAHRTCGTPDPVHNYMNYIGNECQCTFTEGQVDRIWQSLTPDLLALATQPTPEPPQQTPEPPQQTPEPPQQTPAPPPTPGGPAPTPGGPSPTPASPPTPQESSTSFGGSFTPDPQCEDTPGWTNGAGMGCSVYKGVWCSGGKFRGLGLTHNYPNENCCWCGKGL